MIEPSKRDGECTCHINAPCSWCVSLTEEEGDVMWKGGRAALEKLWKEEDEKGKTTP